jgi:hypothetical protein
MICCLRWKGLLITKSYLKFEIASGSDLQTLIRENKLTI